MHAIILTVVENYAEQTQILTTTADTEEASSNKTPSGMFIMPRG